MRIFGRGPERPSVAGFSPADPVGKLPARFFATFPNLKEAMRILAKDSGAEEQLIKDAAYRVAADATEDKKILEWAVESANTNLVVEQLGRLDVDSLQRLNTLVGISSLRNALSLWQANRENSQEEFWQQRLEQNAFVLSQVFSQPVVILKGKAYVGGKGVENAGGNVLDYLCANELTRNALLIEIKTPRTPLLGPLYRGDVYNVSTELSGPSCRSATARIRC